MTALIKNIIYSDFSFSFDAHPIRGDITVLKNIESVKRAVKNIILTNKGERFYDPDKGSDVPRRLFENMTHILVHQIRDDIKNVLQNYEPRVTVLNVEVENKDDVNGLNITIVFRVDSFPEPATLIVILKKVR